MTQRYDLVIVGGGPSGAAAAWQASQTGAKVVVLDKAEFPRDKPCGDGLTARAVSYLQKMGLGEEVTSSIASNRVTVFSPVAVGAVVSRSAPACPTTATSRAAPAARHMLLNHAESAGAEIREVVEVIGPELDASGRVVGVILKGGEKVYGDAVIAADGAYSPIKRAMKIDSEYNGYSAIAIRAEMPANKPDSDSLDIYLKLRSRRPAARLRWVFPFGGGQINIGLGYVNSYKKWQQINATQFMGEFMETLPREWDLPPIDDLKKDKVVRAWRLPMGFTAWPPWRPGVLFTGDSLGAGKPASGAGISKALESGLAAGECAIAALHERRTGRLHQLRSADGSGVGQEYKRGRYFHKLRASRQSRTMASSSSTTPASAT